MLGSEDDRFTRRSENTEVKNTLDEDTGTRMLEEYRKHSLHFLSGQLSTPGKIGYSHFFKNYYKMEIKTKQKPKQYLNINQLKIETNKVLQQTKES